MEDITEVLNEPVKDRRCLHIYGCQLKSKAHLCEKMGYIDGCIDFFFILHVFFRSTTTHTYLPSRISSRPRGKTPSLLLYSISNMTVFELHGAFRMHYCMHSIQCMIQWYSSTSLTSCQLTSSLFSNTIRAYMGSMYASSFWQLKTLHIANTMTSFHWFVSKERYSCDRNTENDGWKGSEVLPQHSCTATLKDRQIRCYLETVTRLNS